MEAIRKGEIFETPHDAEIRRLTSRQWALTSLNEMADGRTFTLTEACSQASWTGTYEAGRSFLDVQLNPVFSQNSISAHGVCSKTCYSSGGKEDRIVPNAGFSFAAAADAI